MPHKELYVSKFGERPESYLVVIGHSTVAYLAAIRRADSWFFYVLYKIVSRFFFGLNANEWADNHWDELLRESDAFNDIVFLRDHTESYETLTEKTQLMMIYMSEIMNYQYYFKGDDNTALNLTSLWRVRFVAVQLRCVSRCRTAILLF